MHWEDLTSPEFDEAIEKSEGVCLLPIGCLEKHGEHLVVGCDGYAASHVASLAAEKEYAVVFPTGHWLGEVIPNHSNDRDLLKKKQLRGYISIKPQTLLTVLEELCDEIHRNGFNKILIVNSHGGNTALLNLFARSILYTKRDYCVLWTNINSVGNGDAFYEKISSQRERFNYLTEEDFKTLERFSETGFGGGHAAFPEVAYCYGKDPKLVRPEKFYQEAQSIHRMDHITSKAINFGGSWMADNPKAFGGYAPLGCTEAIGKAYCEIVSDNLAEKIRAVKADTECLKIARRED
jgi:creatinine amidohydrolase